MRLSFSFSQSEDKFLKINLNYGVLQNGISLVHQIKSCTRRTLVIRKGHHLAPIIYGGGHQQGLRSGTLNVPGIVGLGEACRLRQLEMAEDEKAIALKRDKLQKYLQDNIPELVINGDTTARLAGNLHISLPNLPNSAIIARIRHKLAISTGAACSSGAASPSHVLRAMKLPETLIEGVLRIGIGKFTTDEEIEEAGAILSTAFEQVLYALQTSIHSSTMSTA